MENISPISPRSPASDLDFVLSGNLALSGLSNVSQIPGREPIRSASQVPSKTSAWASQNLALLHWMEHHHKVMENQRELHRQERELWQMEREELSNRISELEGIISSLRRTPSTKKTSVLGKPIAQQLNGDQKDAQRIRPHGRAGKPWDGAEEGEALRAMMPAGPGTAEDSAATDDSCQAHTEPSHEEDPSTERRSTIAEARQSHKVDFAVQVDLVDDEPARKTRRHQPASMDGSAIDGDLDGITFKTTAIANPLTKTIIPRMPSLQLPFSQPRPGKTQLLETHEPPDDQDPYTKDAGHTPIPRFHGSLVLSPAYEAHSPPTNHDLQDSGPETTRKPPNERSASYFPAPAGLPLDQHEVASTDSDPALTGPLGLVNHGPHDEQFLSTLDTKLEEAKQLPRDTLHQGDEDNSRDRHTLVPPQSVPGLRLKRSMNFGTVFGAATCGKEL